MRDLCGRIIKAPVLNKRSTGALVAKGSCEFLATSPSTSPSPDSSLYNTAGIIDDSALQKDFSIEIMSQKTIELNRKKG